MMTTLRTRQRPTCTDSRQTNEKLQLFLGLLRLGLRRFWGGCPRGVRKTPVFRVSGGFGCPRGVREVSARCPRGVREVSARCPRGVREVSARCPRGVREVSARCPRGVREVSARCPRGVREVSAGCPQDTAISQYRRLSGTYSGGWRRAAVSLVLQRFSVPQKGCRSAGRLAQSGESASLTRKRSAVRVRQRPRTGVLAVQGLLAFIERAAQPYRHALWSTPAEC